MNRIISQKMPAFPLTMLPVLWGETINVLIIQFTDKFLCIVLTNTDFSQLNFLYKLPTFCPVCVFIVIKMQNIYFIDNSYTYLWSVCFAHFTISGCSCFVMSLKLMESMWFPCCWFKLVVPRLCFYKVGHLLMPALVVGHIKRLLAI
jgi:hypothetical protein